MKIKSERMWLRPINEKDKEKIRNWRNDHRQFFFDSKEITIEAQNKWFNKYTQLPSGTDIIFIPTLYSGEEIGMISLYDVEMDTRSAQIGRVLLLDKYRHHEYSQEMINTLCKFAFDTMRLYKLTVKTDITNDDAISVYHKAGFRIVGQEFLSVSKFTYRIIIIMDKINTNYNPKSSIALCVIEEVE